MPTGRGDLQRALGVFLAFHFRQVNIEGRLSWWQAHHQELRVSRRGVHFHANRRGIDADDGG